MTYLMFKWILSSRLVKFGFLLIGLIVLFYSWESFQHIDLKGWLLEPKEWWIVWAVLWGLSLVKSILFFLPIQLVYVTSGIYFPMETAALLCLLGLVLEMTITYFIGIKAGRKTVARFISKENKWSKWFNTYKQHEFSGMFWARLTPFSIEAISLLLGAAGAKYKLYIIASTLGSLPKVVFFVMIGSIISQGEVGASLLTFLLMTLGWCIVIAFLIGRKQIVWRKQTEQNASNTLNSCDGK